MIFNKILIQGILKQRGFKQCSFSISRLTFWSQNIRCQSEIGVIPRNSAIFGYLHSIDSKSAVSNSAINFLDKNARYSRTYCMMEKKFREKFLTSAYWEKKLKKLHSFVFIIQYIYYPYYPLTKIVNSRRRKK